VHFEDYPDVTENYLHISILIQILFVFFSRFAVVGNPFPPSGGLTRYVQEDGSDLGTLNLTTPMDAPPN